MGKAEEVRKNLVFLDAPEGVVAFQLKNNAGGDSWKDIIVVLNANKTERAINVPEGLYTKVLANGKVDENGLGILNGSSVTVAPQSALIIHN